MKRKWNAVLGGLGGLALLFSLGACKGKSEYEKLVERELATKVRNDSLFLGIYFGMTGKEFYVHCWDMNKMGLVRQGTTNTTVEYKLDDELPFQATMDFYPEFQDEKIVEMPVMFYYDGWAPWNKRLSADSLQVDVVDLMKDWYGGKEFIRVNHPDTTRGAAFVKVDGNRRIVVARLDDRVVKVQFTDLSVERKKPEEQEKTEAQTAPEAAAEPAQTEKK